MFATGFLSCGVGGMKYNTLCDAIFVFNSCDR